MISIEKYLQYRTDLHTTFTDLLSRHRVRPPQCVEALKDSQAHADDVGDELRDIACTYADYRALYGAHTVYRRSNVLQHLAAEDIYLSLEEAAAIPTCEDYEGLTPQLIRELGDLHLSPTIIAGVAHIVRPVWFHDAQFLHWIHSGGVVRMRNTPGKTVVPVVISIRASTADQPAALVLWPYGGRATSIMDPPPYVLQELRTLIDKYSHRDVEHSVLICDGDLQDICPHYTSQEDQDEQC